MIDDFWDKVFALEPEFELAGIKFKYEYNSNYSGSHDLYIDKDQFWIRYGYDKELEITHFRRTSKIPNMADMIELTPKDFFAHLESILEGARV